MQVLKLIIALFFLSALSLSAQTDMIVADIITPAPGGGQVLMEEDSLLVGLIELQKEVNGYDSGVNGFRIKLYSGNNAQTSREEAFNAKALFLEKYPDAEVYLDFQAPYWRVRVGDFKTYGDALKLKNELEIELASIKDQINIVPAIVKIK